MPCAKGLDASVHVGMENFLMSFICPSDVIEAHLGSLNLPAPPHTQDHHHIPVEMSITLPFDLQQTGLARQWWFVRSSCCSFLILDSALVSTLMLMKRKIPEVPRFCQCTVCFQSNSSTVFKELSKYLLFDRIHSLLTLPLIPEPSLYSTPLLQLLLHHERAFHVKA